MRWLRRSGSIVTASTLAVAAAIVVLATPALAVDPTPSSIPSSASSVSASPSPAGAPAASPVPLVGVDVGTMVTCGSGYFPVVALAGPRGAELGNDAPAARLRLAIAAGAGPGAGGVPPTGWMRVIDTPEAVLFVAWTLVPDADGRPLWFVQVQPRVAEGPAVDGWDVWAAGRCWPQVAMPEGLESAGWELESPVSAADDRFVALVTERECASGRPATGRVAVPVIVMGPDTVIITFGIRPPGGDQACPSNPPTPYEVVLPEPLGRRTLLDGSGFPMRVVQAAPPEG